jgi:hypothetical protein
VPFATARATAGPHRRLHHAIQFDDCGKGLSAVSTPRSGTCPCCTGTRGRHPETGSGDRPDSYTCPDTDP